MVARVAIARTRGAVANTELAAMIRTVNLGAVLAVVLALFAFAKTCFGVAVTAAVAGIRTEPVLAVFATPAVGTITLVVLAHTIARAIASAAQLILAIHTAISRVAHTAGAVTESVTVAIVETANGFASKSIITRFAFALSVHTHTVAAAIVHASVFRAIDATPARETATFGAQTNSVIRAISGTTNGEFRLIDPFGIVLREPAIRLLMVTRFNHNGSGGRRGG